MKQTLHIERPCVLRVLADRNDGTIGRPSASQTTSEKGVGVPGGELNASSEVGRALDQPATNAAISAMKDDGAAKDGRGTHERVCRDSRRDGRDAINRCIGEVGPRVAPVQCQVMATNVRRHGARKALRRRKCARSQQPASRISKQSLACSLIPRVHAIQRPRSAQSQHPRY